MAKIMQRGNRQIQVNNKTELETLVAKGYTEVKNETPKGSVNNDKEEGGSNNGE